MNASSSRTLGLEWENPLLDDRDGTVTSYEVNCTSTFGYYYFVSVAGGVLECDIVDLALFSNYSCCVRALTTNGYSNSACAMEQTLQDSKLQELMYWVIILDDIDPVFFSTSRCATKCDGQQSQCLRCVY